MVTMTANQPYEPPVLAEIGTLHELTLQGKNKIGTAADQFTGQTGLVGSIDQIGDPA